MYSFIRTDIPLADQIVQTGHSSLLAGAAFKPPDGHYFILIGIDSLKELLEVAEDFNDRQIRYEAFYEPSNAAGVELGWTSITTEPIPEAFRGAFQKFNLWKLPEPPEEPKGWADRWLEKLRNLFKKQITSTSTHT